MRPPLASLQIGEILAAARHLEASDIVLGVNAAPLFRIGGAWRTLSDEVLLPATLQAIIAMMVTDRGRRRRRRRGVITRRWSDHLYGDFRLRLIGHPRDPRLSIRVLSAVTDEASYRNLPSIILPYLARRAGLLLIVGPSGSGKSSMIATCLTAVAREQDRRLGMMTPLLEHTLPIPATRLMTQERVVDRRSLRDAIRDMSYGGCDVIAVDGLPEPSCLLELARLSHAGHLVLVSVTTANMRAALINLLALAESCAESERRILASAIIGLIGCELIAGRENRRVLLPEVVFGGETLERFLQYAQRESRLPDDLEQTFGGQARTVSLAALIARGIVDSRSGI